jgi:hypothetical protein
LEDLISYSRDASAEDCRGFLAGKSPLWPSAIILDSTATRFFGAETVEREFGMIPSGDENMNGQLFALIPAHLAPDKISEFPIEDSIRQIRDKIENRAGLRDAMSVTVYLCDLLAAFSGVPIEGEQEDGGSHREEPHSIQLLPGCCRFTFPVTLEELKTKAKVVQNIHEFLAKCHRCAKLDEQ